MDATVLASTDACIAIASGTGPAAKGAAGGLNRAGSGIVHFSQPTLGLGPDRDTNIDLEVVTDGDSLAGLPHLWRGLGSFSPLLALLPGLLRVVSHDRSLLMNERGVYCPTRDRFSFCKKQAMCSQVNAGNLEKAVWSRPTAPFEGVSRAPVRQAEANRSEMAPARRHRSHLERSSRHGMTRIGLRPLLYICHHRPVNAYPISLDISHPEWDRPGRPGTRRGPAPARGPSAGGPRPTPHPRGRPAAAEGVDVEDRSPRAGWAAPPPGTTLG
jgi:hypothetical protein